MGSKDVRSKSLSTPSNRHRTAAASGPNFQIHEALQDRRTSQARIPGSQHRFNFHGEDTRKYSGQNLISQQPNEPWCNSSKTFRKMGNWVAGEELIEVAVLNPTAMASLWLRFPFVFRIGDHGSPGPSLLREVCLERGWKEYNNGILESDNNGSKEIPFYFSIGWNIWWSHSNYSAKNMEGFSSWQLVNRTERNFAFTSKDTCTRYIRRLRNTYGDIYDLCPLTFNVPSEYPKLCIEHTKRKSRAFWSFWDRAHYIGTPLHRPVDLEAQPIWICKPVGKSQGKGITVFDTVTNLSYNTRSVVQEYITRPHLIGNYKWDLRIYVCIVSIQPLVFYAYREGLVRFATNPFDLRNLNNSFSHLTNSSVNKQSPAYFQNKNGVGRGCKWSLRKLRRYFLDKGIRDWYLWQRIATILILTIIGDPGIFNNLHQPSKANTFFLMGFDIMVDRSLRPVLVEVNSNPSLSNDCEVDRLVKKPMLRDLFDLLHLPDGRHFESYLDTNPIMYNYLPTHPIRTNSDDEVSSDSSSSGEESSSGYDSVQQSPSGSSGISSNQDHVNPSILYVSGSIPGYKSLVNLAFKGDTPLERMGAGELLIPRQTQFPSQIKFKPSRPEYPVLVSLPIKKQQRSRRTYASATSSWQSGIMLKRPNWRTESPQQVGNWVRIFPFNKETEKLASAGKAFDVKDAIRHVQELMKFADQFGKGEEQDDNSLDQLLKGKVGSTTRAWHPPSGSGKKPRF